MDKSILALDVGSTRTGVSIATLAAKLPRPLTTLVAHDLLAHIARLVSDNNAVALVVGLPRNLEGEDTQQTAAVRAFVEKVKQAVQVPVHLQDEALTSKKAEEELQARGVSYSKGDIDALAATFILEDFLQSPDGASLQEDAGV